MAEPNLPWRPGSFTKNFSWGRASNGLVELHTVIRVGFADTMEDVPRALFRERVKAIRRPVLIPINFFLFNKPKHGVVHLVADELVFQALNYDHSERFDRLALFAFNWSMVGKFPRANPSQRYPAMWSKAYVRDRFAPVHDWDVRKATRDDIEAFLQGSPRYVAQGTEKVGTNLSYFYRLGGLGEFGTKAVTRWWVDALFLAMDRLIEDRDLSGRATHPTQYEALLLDEDFMAVSGRRSLEKDVALRHLLRLYEACGGRRRFSEEHVRERTQTLLPDLQRWAHNDPRPRGAVHPTNVRILKSIPQACAMLAHYVAGFEDLGPDQLEDFDVEEWVRERTQRALQDLQDRDIRPTMTAEELLRMTRDR